MTQGDGGQRNQGDRLPHVDPAPVVREALRADAVVLLLTSGALGGLIETLPLPAEELFPA